MAHIYNINYNCYLRYYYLCVIRIGDPIHNYHDLERGHDHSIEKRCSRLRAFTLIRLSVLRTEFLNETNIAAFPVL